MQGCPCAWSETSFYPDLDGDLSDLVEALRHTDQLFDRDMLTLSDRMERREARSEPCFVEDEMSDPFDGRSGGVLSNLRQQHRQLGR